MMNYLFSKGNDNLCTENNVTLQVIVFIIEQNKLIMNLLYNVIIFANLQFSLIKTSQEEMKKYFPKRFIPFIFMLQDPHV